MKKILTYSILLAFIFISSCLLKPTFKNPADISKGDNKQKILEKWGEPDFIDIEESNLGKSELWVYKCVVTVSCEDSDCFFNAPCYYLYFLKDKLISKYDNT